jgi:hypothetical protein
VYPRLTPNYLSLLNAVIKDMHHRAQQKGRLLKDADACSQGIKNYGEDTELFLR